MRGAQIAFTDGHARGFVVDALRRHGIEGASAPPPASGTPAVD
ncbi:MAG TPA: hypothetical protein VMR43_11820 [Variovorax sp.]|nr:hypothetical protein [Variovorax sp.]